MRFCRTQLFKPLLYLSCVLVFASCSEQKFLFFNRIAVKNAPVDTPFVYSNTVIVEGIDSKDEKKRLTDELNNYWDDSLKARMQQRFGVFYRIKNPPVFDSMNIPLTRNFMQSYLRSQGYYYGTLKDSLQIDTIAAQRRVNLFMIVKPGKATIIDSFAFNLADTQLQKLTLAEKSGSLIQPGKTIFTKEVISNELDRLVAVYRRNGYYRFTKDDILAYSDTTDPNSLILSADPFEQAQQIAASDERQKKNPTVNIDIILRYQYDSIYNPEKFIQYKNGLVYYYPETGVQETADSLIASRNLYEHRRGNYILRDREHKFVLRPLTDHTDLVKGELYNEEKYYKTLNSIGQVGAWLQVDAKTVVRADSLDYHIFMVPAIKQNITFDVETSRNTGDLLGSQNLFGVALNTTYRNRNVWKRAIQSSTSFRNGIELNVADKKFELQTLQSSLSHTYSFPRFITPFGLLKNKKPEGMRTLLSFNASYADRREFFRLRSLVTTFGYEWKNGNKVWQYRPLNVELYSFDKLAGLDSAIKNNPFLQFAFNEGSVVSQVLTFNVAYNGKKNTNHSHFFRFGVEEAGAILGRFKGLRNQIFQYIKLDGEYRRRISFTKTQLAFRGMAGVGINYSDDPKIGTTLPFFKQFVGGGPNSMRAWGLRQIGLGSSLLSDTSNTFRDRFGDMQLETNVEFRYPITTIGALKLNGALFTDIGNIWNIRKTDANPKAAFSISRLAEDIAIGVGTGLRFDFDYFLIRVDMGLKLRDPARLENNGWLSIKDFTWINKEFNIVDASGKRVNRNNYAIQLGIGLPF